jgi:hypothetical protein
MRRYLAVLAVFGLAAFATPAHATDIEPTYVIVDLDGKIPKKAKKEKRSKKKDRKIEVRAVVGLDPVDDLPELMDAPVVEATSEDSTATE